MKDDTSTPTTEGEPECRLEDVIISDQLARRPSRAPDYEAESAALSQLARELAERPEGILQALTDLIVERGWADSAGISIDTRIDGERRFLWEALSGAWAGYRGGTMPFDASPCGVVVDRNAMILFEHPERFFPDVYVEPLIQEILLVPFGVGAQVDGTLWINAHSASRKFEREDARLMKSLASFAAAGFQAMGKLRQQSQSQTALRQSEQRYAHLFETMGQAYVLGEVVRDPNGEALDFRLIELNSAYERLMGVSAEQARGRGIYELLPDIDRWWLETCDRVARSGQSERVEQQYNPGGVWFEAWLYPREQDRIEALFEDISERKRGEIMVRESEERLRLAVEGSKIAVYECDLDLRYTWIANPAAGWKEADLIGCRDDELLPPDDARPLMEFKRRALASDGPLEEEITGTPSGTARCFLMRAEKLADSASEPRWLRVLALDIEDLKSAERSLRTSEERQAFLLTLSDELHQLEDASAVRATATRILGEKICADHVYYVEYEATEGIAFVADDFAAPKRPSLAGRYPAEAFSTTFAQLAQEQPWVVGDSAIEPSLAADERAYYVGREVRAWVNIPLHKGGALRAVLCVVQGAPRRWSEQEIRLVSETAERLWDAIERSRAESALRESRERLQLIVENAEDYAIFTTDPAGIVTDWREGAQAVFGYTSEEIVGQDCAILFTPADRAAGAPEAERATAASEGKAPDVRWHVRKDGSRVFIDGISTVLKSPEGRVIGFLKIGQDTTDRHAADERQKLLLAELQHRVRNTLGMIRSMVRFTAEGHEDIEDYLSHLTGRLDTLSRTQQLLTRSPNTGVDLHELVSEEMTAQAGGRSAYEVDGPPVTLSAKAAEVLSLALHELVTNSVKYGVLGQAPGIGGAVRVRWQVVSHGAQDWLELRWREPVTQAIESGFEPGFGTELITERVPYELRGRASLEIGPNEIEARIDFPLASGASLLETGAPR